MIINNCEHFVNWCRDSNTTDSI
ncbi:hypothetical protein [Bacillus sp. V5-8f]